MNDFKDQLLSQVSHELKTPLNCMIQLCENSRYEKDQEFILKNNHIVLQNCQILLNQIQDLMDYSNLIKGEFKLRIQDFSLRELILQVLEIFDSQIQEQKMKIEMNYQFSPEDFILMENDNLRIKQILVNLIGNSLKYTPPGGTIRITVEHSEANSQLILVTV